MDSLAERLRGLRHNTYFAYIAVIFFAFLIALVFALFALQPSLAPTADDIRSSVTGVGMDGTGTSGTPGTGGSGTGAGTTGTGTSGTGAPGEQTPSQTGTGAQTSTQTTSDKPSIFERIIAVFTGKSSLPQHTTTGTGTSQNTGTSPANEAKKRVEAVEKVLRESKGVPEIGSGPCDAGYHAYSYAWDSTSYHGDTGIVFADMNAVLHCKVNDGDLFGMASPDGEEDEDVISREDESDSDFEVEPRKLSKVESPNFLTRVRLLVIRKVTIDNLGGDGFKITIK